MCQKPYSRGGRVQRARGAPLAPPAAAASARHPRPAPRGRPGRALCSGPARVRRGAARALRLLHAGAPQLQPAARALRSASRERGHYTGDGGAAGGRRSEPNRSRAALKLRRGARGAHRAALPALLHLGRLAAHGGEFRRLAGAPALRRPPPRQGARYCGAAEED
ncbi:hypothetical protein JYU34_002190 [Plutella xylostella]|uniref:Uncharacterized protein n=1 Tax=Plutella xylostella TaxID=51655 RepID=A0ABQ7R1M1_PLUXY|nr:hypothetical protein JYU34_002190 [Plutella xylostella]